MISNNLSNLSSWLVIYQQFTSKTAKRVRKEVLSVSQFSLGPKWKARHDNTKQRYYEHNRQMFFLAFKFVSYLFVWMFSLVFDIV